MPHTDGAGLGIDIGGTFTDLVLYDRGTGDMVVGKVLTNYEDLATGVLGGVSDLLAQHEIAPSHVKEVVHGTTLVTNALIERRGAPTALLVTTGFRDLLEMGRESRYDIFDIDLEIPQPLVPRACVFEVLERLDAQGTVVQPLDHDRVSALARKLDEAEFRAVAVCFLHSFRNPAHERAVAAIFSQVAPDISVSLSSDVMPDIREYERAVTTTANAYVQPLIESYLDRLSAGLRSSGVAVDPFLIGSDAGRVARATATKYPVRLVESGPAGGAVAASFVARRSDITQVIAFDMGGTTAKMCVIDDGEPAHTDSFEVARVSRFAKGSGLPLKVPVIEMIEIGAGGGSIARVDDRGLLQVGPESAAAHPGPVCYGFGGTRATVTDADLYLGYLDPAFFLGGAMRLDADTAASAIQQQIAQPLGLTSVRAAWGIHAVVNDNMARAAKVHCLELGKDPREYVLVAYGGAGPVHAWQIAATLGIRHILYPLHAGAMSALGFLVAPATFTLMRAAPQAIEAVEFQAADRLLAELVAEATDAVHQTGVPRNQLSIRREATLRFTGQTYALSVPLPPGPVSPSHLTRLRDAFFELYEGRYHHLPRDLPVELVSWRVVVTGPAPQIALCPPVWADNGPKSYRDVFFPEVGGFVSCPIYDRLALPPGQQLDGPAVIEERESTVIIGPGGTLRVDDYGNLLADLPATTRVQQ